MRIDLGRGFVLRSWRLNDATALQKYANNRKVWINLRDIFPHPYTKKDADHWLGITVGKKPERNLAIATKEEAIGGIGLVYQEDVNSGTGEIGYWLAEPFWGQGIATLALNAFCKEVFAKTALIRLQACVFEWNEASGRVLEKAGFQLEGRLRKNVTKAGKTADQLIYGRLRSPLKSSKKPQNKSQNTSRFYPV